MARNWKKPSRAAASGGGDGVLRIYGLHAAEAALRNPSRPILRVAFTENAERRLGDAAALRGLAPERVSPRDLDRTLGAETVHQGVLVEAGPLPEPTLGEAAARAAAGAPMVVLDQVTDPHNVGAILRSAAVFGASGLVMTRRHSPPLDGALAKAASGALEIVPVVLVQNLAVALANLTDEGFWAVGLDGAAEGAIEDAPLAGKIALVLGAEGKGLRQLTRERCAELRRIGSSSGLASLNVSNAAAVALHMSALRRR